jgi:hypothetical protein
MALERLVFYSSLPCGRAKQIVPALFSKILWDACEPFSGITAIESAFNGRAICPSYMEAMPQHHL